MLLECIKRLVQRRVCQLKKITDLLGVDSLAIGERLFGPGYARINASRSLQVWWKDNVVNPFVRRAYFWTFAELLKPIERAGCEFHATSPKWSRVDHFAWYKNVPTPAARHRKLVADVRGALVYFLTGLPVPDAPAAPNDVWDAVMNLQQEISSYTTVAVPDITKVSYPAPLAEHLVKHPEPSVRSLARGSGSPFRLVAVGIGGADHTDLSGTGIVATALGRAVSLPGV